jgi:hypothetical protein
MFTVCGAPMYAGCVIPTLRNRCATSQEPRRRGLEQPTVSPDGAFATPPTNSSPSARSRDGVEAEGRRADEPLAIGLLEWLRLLTAPAPLVVTGSEPLRCQWGQVEARTAGSFHEFDQRE